MMTFIPPRLRKPAIYALAGLLFAAAWLVRGGPLWWVSIMAVIGTAAGAIRLYLLGGTDTDEGARAGSRADERQQLISLRSRALACNLAALTSFIGLTAAIAVKATWGWPVPGHLPHHGLRLPARPGQLRCRRRGHAGRRGHRASGALPG